MNTDKKTQEVFEEKLKQLFPYNHFEILSYTKASGPITFKCLDCGHVYQKSRANHLYENKTLCQQCYTARDGYAWNHFKEKAKRDGFEILDTAVCPATSRKILVKCLKCNASYTLKWANHCYDDSYINCIKCGVSGAPIGLERFIQTASQYHNMSEYEVLNYKGVTKSIIFKHNCGKVFSQLGDNFYKGRGCPECYGKKSRGEQKIASILEQKGINFIEQYKLDNFSTKLSYDFYLPDYGILIEYQGEQHYHPCNFFGGEEKFQQQVANDKLKRENAINANLELIEIPYTQYSNIETYFEGSTTILERSRVKQPEAESVVNTTMI